MCVTGYLYSQGHWCPEVEVCHSDSDNVGEEIGLNGGGDTEDTV